MIQILSADTLMDVKATLLTARSIRQKLAAAGIEAKPLLELFKPVPAAFERLEDDLVRCIEGESNQISDKASKGLAKVYPHFDIERSIAKIVEYESGR